MSQLFRLKNGTVLLSTEAPGGIYNSGQLKKIAELCSKELAIVKATEDQRLALFVKESEVESVIQQLRSMGLGFRHYQDSLHQPISCLGELCEEHEQPAMATAMDITKEIANIQLDSPLKIGINGCARCCTPCHTLDIAVVGDTSGYRISLGGKTKQMPEFASYFAEGIPPKELPKRVKAVIEAFKNLAESGESLHDVIERCGVTDFVQALAPYSQDAAHRKDPFAEDADSSLDLSGPADLDIPEDLATESTDELDLGEDADLAVEEDLSADADLDVDAELSADTDLDVEENLDGGEGRGADADLEVEEDLNLAVEDDLDLDTELSADAELGSDDEISLADDSEDLAVVDNAILDDETEEVPVDDELNSSDLDEDPITLDDDAGGTLEEIPIEHEDQGSLEDDLSMNDDLGADLETSASDDLLIEDDSVEEDIIAEDEELVLTQETPEDLELMGDDVVLEEIDAEEEILLEADDEVSVVEIGDDAEDLSSLETAADISDDFAEDISVEETSAHIPEDELEFDDSDLQVAAEESLEEEAELVLDESMSPDDELSEDLDDTALGTTDSVLDEDLEGIPELDEDLAPEELPIPKPMAAKAPVVELDEDFGEDLPSDSPDLSDEEESQFEQKLHASIDEESRLIAKEDKDPNVGDRQAALSLLEQDDSEDTELDLETSEDGDEELEPINETMEEFPEPGPKELAQISARQHGQKLHSSSSRQQFKLSEISFQDDHMRVTFESGAYVDFDLSALGLGEERSFRLGVQTVSVTSTTEGYILEVDGMRLFHPKSSLSAAS